MQRLIGAEVTTISCHEKVSLPVITQQFSGASKVQFIVTYFERCDVAHYHFFPRIFAVFDQESVTHAVRHSHVAVDYSSLVQ